jgi:hypothetical protein
MLAPTIRRFSPADLTSSAGWIMEKLRVLYPSKGEVALANWLRMLANRNDCQFLRTDHAIELAEVVVLNLMDEHPVIYERFVWCENRQSNQHIEEAMLLYGEMRRWAKSMSVAKIIVNQSSDVPRERIGECFWSKRLFPEQLDIARV